MQKYIDNTYEIIEKIGAGNGGTVYKAYHRNLNKYVVLKKVNTDIQDLMNTRTEVDVLKNLKHTCLPQVFNFVEDNGSVYTVMDLFPENLSSSTWMQEPYFRNVLLLSG